MNIEAILRGLGGIDPTGKQKTEADIKAAKDFCDRLKRMTSSLLN